MAIRPAQTSALARLFERAFQSGEAVGLALPGGAPLFKAGEPSDVLYLLRFGRLAASAAGPEGASRLLGLVHPGETAGEFSLLAGQAHQVSVTALRDSELLALGREAFLGAAGRDAEVMGELARRMAERVRHIIPGSPVSPPRVFGLIGLHGGLEIRGLGQALCRIMGEAGWRAVCAGAEVARQPVDWFSRFEESHDFVLYAAESQEDDWISRLARQLDHLVLIGDGELAPPSLSEPIRRAAARFGPLTDLALLHRAGAAAPQGAAAYDAALAPGRIVHLRRGQNSDLARLARRVSGQSVGLVLSGGASRAFAHVGALAALKAAKVPLDFLAGVSMGAIIAAGEAMEWSCEELERRIRRAFVESSPVDDIALPLIAMTHGRKVRARLAEHFGERRIEDLWRPFFCLSSNLTTGAFQLHRRGPLVEALTASVALPGLLPPVVSGGDVLVDGAVIKNFPTDVMRTVHAGPIVGVDVTRGRSLDAAELSGGFSLWRWLLSGGWRAGPPIVSILMRAGTVGAESDLAAARAAADLLIMPEIDDIEIRDWKAFGPACAAGERAASEVLAHLGRRVTELRLGPASKPWILAGGER